MRLTWVSGCAIVHSGPEPGAGMTALVARASGPNEMAVVVASHTLRLLPPMMNELADLLVEQLPPRCTRLRLVAWNSGCLHDDRPAPAYQLATRLGIEVIAPAGPLLGVPGGSLFAPAGRGVQKPGGWWRFAPGSAPSRVGWRYPAPQWESDLAELGEPAHDLVVEQVPAGLWAHRAGYHSATDLVYSVPADLADPALIVSHPDEQPLSRDELARIISALPMRAIERIVFTPYGPRPVADSRLGDAAASLLGGGARVRTGLPLYAAAGKRALVTVDADSRPRWRPFVRELRYQAHAAFAAPADWTNPAPSFLGPPVAHATFALGSGWAVEVIESGLWVRPAQPVESVEWVRTLPLKVDECLVVVGATPGGYPPPGPVVATLLQHLPADARSRVRIAVPRGAGDDVMSLATALCAQLPEAAQVRVLGHEEPPAPPLPAPPRIDPPRAEPARVESRLETTGGIRSHRPGLGRAERHIQDEKADTNELHRLLGFFDEIRRARAWDEEPAGRP
jgi:hypothetical protein